jgi:hypothetical protein
MSFSGISWRVFALALFLGIPQLHAAQDAAGPSCPYEFAAYPWAKRAQAMHVRDGGSTLDPRTGESLVGKPLVSLSIFPELTQIVAGRKPDEATLAAYYLRNWQLLDDRRVSIGTWYNAELNRTEIDVVLTLPATTPAELERARALARRYNQIAIFDLGHGQVLDTGGSGLPVGSLPPPFERLRDLDTAAP